jgi:molybdate transport system substrate-binding protein
MKKTLLLLSLALMASALSAQAIELNVYAAASLTESLQEIGLAYEKQAGDKLVFNFAASSTLARQIQ